MNVHRFNNIPINLDTMSRPEIFKLNTYAHQHLTQALGEVATLNKFMGERDMFSLRVVPEFGEPMTSFEHDPFIDDLTNRQKDDLSKPPKEAA